MTQQIEARFRHGKFEPLTPVNFREDAVLKLSVEDPTEPSTTQPNNPTMTMMEWLESVRPLREQIAQREGLLPDSTFFIAEDRMR